MKQFIRHYRLDIGNNKESISITDLKIEFSVTKTISSEPNPAEIKITNLNESHRAVIASKAYNYVRLLVSYGNDDLRLIFSGDIVKAEVTREGMDFVTSLSCADGFEAFTNSVTMTTLNSGSADNDAVNLAVKNMGIEKGNVDLAHDRILPRGKVMMCETKDVLDKVAMNNNADWSIQDNQLIIIPKNKALKDDSGFILSQTTGLIGSPKKTTMGIELDCLLNPYFKIGGLVRVESILKSNNGDYKINKIIHSGDSNGNTWKTSLTCDGGVF